MTLRRFFFFGFERDHNDIFFIQRKKFDEILTNSQCEGFRYFTYKKVKIINQRIMEEFVISRFVIGGD